ncbi:b(0,+)-type amino acid transporter 1-like [Chrysoperla carnea]|uniref:b(0,+)-type amino acid transporter 1-like n=1 Tax=Chrysoperla carnea TaxID=189513 RepID=UPI001D08419B|nr:b(0,+)-type amino acid transporter 1-like [Chrysoperla carnea]
MMVFAFYNSFWAYDGWSAITSVTEEVKNPSKNIPRCILISVPFVTTLYVFMNIAYMAELSKDEMETTPTVAVLYGKTILGDFNIIISIGVALSTFGCALSSQFRNTRLYYVASQEGHMIRVLSFLNINRMTPAPAVAFQCIISAIFVIFSDLYGLIVYSSLFLCIFYTLSIVALITLRRTKPDANRPYKVPIVIAYLALIINAFFAIYPIVSNFSLKHIFSLGFVACGIILYTFFVYYKFKFSNLDWFTSIIQKIFQAAPPSLPNTTSKDTSK